MRRLAGVALTLVFLTVATMITEWSRVEGAPASGLHNYRTASPNTHHSRGQVLLRLRAHGVTFSLRHSARYRREGANNAKQLSVTSSSTTCQTGYSFSQCVVVPVSGSFSIATPCGFLLAGSGSASFGGLVIYINPTAVPSTLSGPPCAMSILVSNGSESAVSVGWHVLPGPGGSIRIPPLTAVDSEGKKLSGQWYAYDINLGTWTAVQAPDHTGVFGFVPS